MMLPYRIVVWMGCLCFFVLASISVASDIDPSEEGIEHRGRSRSVAKSNQTADHISLEVPTNKSSIEVARRASSVPPAPRHQGLSVEELLKTAPPAIQPREGPNDGSSTAEPFLFTLEQDDSRWVLVQPTPVKGPPPIFMRPSTYLSHYSPDGERKQRRRAMSLPTNLYIDEEINKFPLPPSTIPKPATSLYEEESTFSLARVAIVLGGGALALSPLGWASYAAAALSTPLAYLAVATTEFLAGVTIRHGISSRSTPTEKKKTA